MSPIVTHRLIVRLVLLAALFVGSYGGITATAVAQEPVTIRFWTTAEDNYADRIAQFHQENPAIRVEAEFIGSYDDMAAKMQTSIAGNDTPDVAQVGQRYGIPQMVDAGVVMPVSDFYSPEEIADFREGLRNRFTYNGELVAIPFESSTPGLWMNETMMREAGLDPANPPQTWDEIVAAAKAMTKDTNGDGTIDQWGFSTCGDAPWYMRAMVLQNGGTLYGADGAPAVNSPESVAMLQWFQDAVTTNQITPPLSQQGSEDAFVAGDYGLLFCSTARRVSYPEEIGDNFEVGVTYLPQQAQRAVGVGGNALIALNSGDAVREEAARTLVRWLTSADQTVVTATTSGYVATRESVMADPRMVDLLANDAFAQTIYDQLQYVRDSSISPADSVLWDGLLAGLETVQTDDSATAQGVLDQLQLDIEDYLDTYD